jgi:large subunit ribosomal protein L17
MRHRRKGRTLGRKPNHQRALLRNLASSLLLTERDDDVDEVGVEYDDFVKPNKPKVKGRIVTTVPKAKEVRRLVERCITIAKKGLEAEAEAAQYETAAQRDTDAWRQWRHSDEWQQWNQAIAPAVTARRRCIQLLGNKIAVEILFDNVAERFADRDGGYTRVVRLAKPRLGDAGEQAVLEFVGKHDRVRQVSQRPAFEDDADDLAEPEAPADETGTDKTDASAESAATEATDGAPSEAVEDSADEPATDEKEKPAD